MKTKLLIREITTQEVILANLQKKVAEVNKNLERFNEEVSAAAQNFRKRQEKSVWQRYWLAILIGIIGVLITNLIWAFRMS